MTARVCTVSGNTVTLLPDRGIECFGCMNNDCKKRPTLLSAENRSNTDLQPGQLVETVLPPGALVRDGAALLPPLLGFLTGFFLVKFFFPQSGEAARAAAGVLFLFAASLAAWFVRRRFPSKTRLEIKRVVE